MTSQSTQAVHHFFKDLQLPKTLSETLSHSLPLAWISLMLRSPKSMGSFSGAWWPQKNTPRPSARRAQKWRSVDWMQRKAPGTASCACSCEMRDDTLHQAPEVGTEGFSDLLLVGSLLGGRSWPRRYISNQSIRQLNATPAGGDMRPFIRLKKAGCVERM